MDILFNIQLFADEVEATETPTENVENENVVSDETTSDDVSFSEEKTPKENKNTSKQNSVNAQRRIEEKQRREREAELKRAKEEGYLDGMKSIIGEKNPYTNVLIEDELDIEMYKTMRKMEKEGLDPIEDYASYSLKARKEESKQAKATQEAEAKKDEAIRNEIAEFDKKYGDGTASKILVDETFKEKYGNLLGRITLEEAYSLYTNGQAEIKAEAERIATEKEAIRKSSAGSPGNLNAQSSSYADMSDEEFRKVLNGMLNSY